MSGITLSEKHGVNPSLDTCVWCGEPKGLILFGRLPKDKEAPKQVATDWEPCDKCKAQWSQGVAILEVRTTSTDRTIPVKAQGGQEVYLTTRMVCIRPEAAERIFERPFKQGDKLFLEDKAFEQIFGEALKNQEVEAK
jgi:hypothetical protein